MIMRIISTIILIILLPTSLFAELQKPTPDIKPEDVVKIQLSSLMNNNQPYVNAGIEQTWEFAHPSNRAFTGPIQRFTQMMYAPSYAVMLDHKKHDIIEVKLENNAAYFFIELTSAEGMMFGFKWTLEKVIEEGVFKDFEISRKPINHIFLLIFLPISPPILKLELYPFVLMSAPVNACI